jgi:hypothetical protein
MLLGLYGSNPNPLFFILRNNKCGNKKYWLLPESEKIVRHAGG